MATGRASAVFRWILKRASYLVFIAALLVVLLLFGLTVRRSIAASLPAPTGKFAVGRIISSWTDSSRHETLGGASGPRQIAVWMWYPAMQTDSPPAAYMPPEWAQAREADRGVGSLFFQSIGSIQSYAVEGAPLAAGGPYPLLVFEPGLGPLVPEYTVLAEDMASHGYVVIGLNPTYSASVTVINGQMILNSDQGSIPDNATPEQAQQQGDRLVEIWAADDRFAIDQVAAMNNDPNNPFNGKLDEGHIGLWGHSFGGASALEACALDSRCLAAADLDGTPFGSVIQEGSDKPVLFVWSEAEDRSDPMVVKLDRDVAAIWGTLTEGYQVTIKGTRHFNFTDLAVEFDPLGHLLGVIGPIDGERGLRIAADYLEAFFGKTLIGQDSPILHEPSPAYPEADLVTIPESGSIG